ncbi:MAG: phosphomannomutase/phosphoglucomutase [Nanoarchaeota archaeon]|nr:phosphomannomutase/phosphoglucomutase [Nanoarchaeota archaeon]
MLNPKIFKSYDIRGIYQTEITGEVAYIVGKALAKMFDAKLIVVGRDARLGSPELHKELLRGLTSQGVEVHDLGLVPIEVMYFAAGKYGYDGGVMVTASHNPKEYAGLKVVRKGVHMVRGKEILEYINQNPGTPDPSSPNSGGGGETKGNVVQKDVRKEYVEHALSFIDKNALKPFKVVVDAGNGMAGQIFPILSKQLPLNIIEMNFEPDGNFPAHPSNPLEPESQKGLTERVVREKADMGVIFDGDADRIFFVDEKGRFLGSDPTICLLARMMLEKIPGAGIAYSVECGRVVSEKIKEWGGRPIRTPVGYVNVSEGMRRDGGVMGGEYSAHYCFKENFYADSGLIAFLLILELASKTDKPFSEVVAEFEVYARAQINLTIHNIPEALQAIKEKYNDGAMDELDGITVWYPDWWFVVRGSNTEPVLRVNIEADTTQILEEKKKEMLSFIESVAKS